MAGSGNWCLIESDPGVFTELMKGFDADGLECDEVYDLKETDNIRDAYGLIFLFKWEGNKSDVGTCIHDANSKGIFFAKQVITNACATQAIINILLNIYDPKVNIGPTLGQFKSFVADFDSCMKGDAITNSEQIRSVHNSFSSYQIFEFDEKLAKKDEDVYHFVGYVPIQGKLYELDGLKDGPIELGTIPEGSSWINVVRPILEKRMQQCVDGNFNLMAVVPNRLDMYQKQLQEMNSRAKGQLSEMATTELERNIEKEKRKAAVYRQENVRRRHNYLPLVVELLKITAENGLLVDLVEKAKTIAQERQKKMRPSAKAES